MATGPTPPCPGDRKSPCLPPRKNAWQRKCGPLKDSPGRKVIVEPVFGQIKEARGFRRFLLRGLDNIRGEWRLVCVTHNLLKIWRYACAPLTA